MLHNAKSHPHTTLKTIENQPIISCELFTNQGYCNDVFLVKTKHHKYILREFKDITIDRTKEYHIHTLAHQYNITSKIINQSQKSMLTEFLEGEHKTSLLTKEIKTLAKLLKKLHTLSYKEEPRSLMFFSDEAKDVLKTIQKIPTQYVLSHNDLNPQNIIFNKNTIKLIDWEYSGLNDRYFDLASVCVEFVFNIKDEKVFLEAYFKDGVVCYKKLEAYKIIYSLLCEEWFNARDKSKV